MKIYFGATLLQHTLHSALLSTSQTNGVASVESAAMSAIVVEISNGQLILVLCVRERKRRRNEGEFDIYWNEGKGVGCSHLGEGWKSGRLGKEEDQMDLQDSLFLYNNDARDA